MTTSDRPRPAAPAAPAPGELPPPDVPLGAQGGFPPPPPLPAEEPADSGTGTTADTTADTTAGTNTMAVLGLVFAFLVPVLGVVFSAVGLAQTGRRGQPGRRLAAAGLVVSLVLTAVAVVLLVTVGTTARRPVDRPQAAAPAAPSPVPAGNPADEAVVAACGRVMPALAQFETDLGSAGTVDEVADRVTTLQQQIAAAATASGDARFAGHARGLAADFGRLVDAARGGGDPAAVVGSIEQDGMTLGQDCGAAGWLP